MSKEKVKIGVFDSGIGGLSVVKKLKQKKIYNFIYLKDSKNFPYGTKTKKELTKIANKNINLLEKRGAKKIIVACHTISFVLKKELKKIAENKNLEIYELATPTLEYLNSKNPNEILFLSTYATKNSINYGFKKIELQKLVELIEKQKNQEIEKTIKNLAKAFKNSKQKEIILGCTHFSLIKNLFKKYFKNKKITDPVDLLFKNIKLNL